MRVMNDAGKPVAVIYEDTETGMMEVRELDEEGNEKCLDSCDGL